MSSVTFQLEHFPTPTYRVNRVVSSSEAAALQGRKALTPWLSGVISGSAVAIMWTVAGIIYMMKRRKRAQRAHERGLRRRELPPRRSVQVEKKLGEKWVVPNDPACTPEEKEVERIRIEVAAAQASGVDRGEATASSSGSAVRKENRSGDLPEKK